jgi:Carboxypeptidase regulatory-like domain
MTKTRFGPLFCFGAATRIVITTLCLLTLVAGILTAQEYRGRVQGTVRDTSDAVIPGASVTLHNINTGISTVRTTNETGHYIFDLVDPGSYRISIENAGFSKFLQENVPVAARGDVTVDATLKAGDVRDTVTVSAEASQVQFSTSKLETSVESKIAGEIPQLYRSPFVLATLDPSVVKDDTQTEYNPFNSWGPGRLSVGGGAQFSNDLQVDGSRVGISVKTGYVPTPDMVQEITISQNTVDAEFGHGGGSAISIVTKSGTNQFHGTAYYDGRYPWARCQTASSVPTTLTGNRSGAALSGTPSSETSCSTLCPLKGGSGPKLHLPLRRRFQTRLNVKGISPNRSTAWAR